MSLAYKCEVLAYGTLCVAHHYAEVQVSFAVAIRKLLSDKM